VLGNIGHVAEFDGLEDWWLYEERLEQYFLANGIEKQRKVPVLLSVIGPRSYKIVKELSNPILPKDRSFSDICDLLRGHFTPTVPIFRKRIDFYELKQKDGESVSAWFAVTKSAAIDCNFGARLNDVLKDKFVSGLKPSRVLDRLCEENPEVKTLKDVVELALKYETTTKSASVSTTDVNKLDARYGKGQHYNKNMWNNKKEFNVKDNKKGNININKEKKLKSNCYACGRDNHRFAECKYKEYICKMCNVKRHLG